MRSQHPSFSKNGCAGSLGHALRTRSFEKRETKEKRGVYVKWKRAYFLGKNAVVQWASAPGLVCEVLEMEPAWEQALSRLLTHAARSQLCEGWRRRARAIRNAVSTRVSSWLAAIASPPTARKNRSSTAAR